MPRDLARPQSLRAKAARLADRLESPPKASTPGRSGHDVANEPRIPKGEPGGGRWTAHGTGIARAQRTLSDLLFQPGYVATKEEIPGTKIVRGADGNTIPDPSSSTGHLIAPPDADFHDVFVAGKQAGPLDVAALFNSVGPAGGI